MPNDIAVNDALSVSQAAADTTNSAGPDDSFDITPADLAAMFNIPEPMTPQPRRKPGELTPADFAPDDDDAISYPADDITLKEAFRIFRETYLDNFGYGPGVFAKAAHMEKNRLKLLLAGRRLPTAEDMAAISRGVEVLDIRRAAEGPSSRRSTIQVSRPAGVRKHYL